MRLSTSDSSRLPSSPFRKPEAWSWRKVETGVDRGSVGAVHLPSVLGVVLDRSCSPWSFRPWGWVRGWTPGPWGACYLWPSGSSKVGLSWRDPHQRLFVPSALRIEHQMPSLTLLRVPMTSLNLSSLIRCGGSCSQDWDLNCFCLLWTDSCMLEGEGRSHAYV